MPMDDRRGGPPTLPATPTFTREMEHLLVRAATGAAGPAARRPPLRSLLGPRTALAMAAAVVAAAIALAAPLPGGGPQAAAAVGMVFPDGQAVDVLGAVLGDGDLYTLRQRLAEVGVDLVVRDLPADPPEAGRVLRIELPPGAKVDEQQRVLVASAQGGAVVLEVGALVTGGPTAGRLGTSDLGSQPALCAAIDAYDPVATARRLADLGYRVRWDLVAPAPGGRGDKAVTERRVALPEPQEGTFIISVLTSGAAGSDLGQRYDLVVEITPTGGAWHAPTRMCR